LIHLGFFVFFEINIKRINHTYPDDTTVYNKKNLCTSFHYWFYRLSPKFVILRAFLNDYEKKLLILMSFILINSLASAQYCTVVEPSSTADTNLEGVTLNGETSTVDFIGTYPEITGLEDQTTMTVDLVAGNEYTWDITWGTCGGDFDNSGTIWIDLNGNEIFEASEAIGEINYPGGTNLQSYTFTVPAAAFDGAHRARIMQWEGEDLPLDPCGTYTWGSVVDFSVIISGGSSCSSIMDLTLDSFDVESADISWTLGDSESEWEISYGLEGFTP